MLLFLFFSLAWKQLPELLFRFSWCCMSPRSTGSSPKLILAGMKPTRLHIVLTMLEFSPAFSKIYNLFSGTMYETTQCKCRCCFLPWRFFRILFACRICFLHSEIFSCAAAILFSLPKRCTELDWSQTTHVKKPFY